MAKLTQSFSLLFLIVFNIGCSNEPGDSIQLVGEFFISTNGNDNNIGTIESPFATLEKARDEIRVRRANSTLEDGPITVWLRGGNYYRTTSFNLTSKDSTTVGSPITYSAYQDENVHISGGIEIRNFTSISDQNLIGRLNGEASSHIVQANLFTLGHFDFNELTSRFNAENTDIAPSGAELFFNGQPMTLARWPNEGWTTITSLPTGTLSGLIGYEGNRPDNWSNVEDIILYGYWRYNWFANYETISSINSEDNTIQTNYVPPPNPYGFLEGQRYMAINVLEELDEPGEWYIDKSTGILYFWPPTNPEEANIYLSILDTPIIRMNQTSHITFSNITFEYTRGAGVEIIGGNHNIVAACTIRNIGTVGVAIGGMVKDILWQTNFNPTFSGYGGTFNGVSGCDIYNTGLGGILLGGGDRNSLEHGNNYATNNKIYNYSRLAKTDRPAIYMYGVGNAVSHNKLHDGPDLALTFWGNEHIIEYNEVYNVGVDIDDAGAMKIGRDYTQRGTIIRYNYIHDLVGEVQGSHIGVYLDDFQSGITIYGNIFENVNLGINIGGGRDNIIENNIFINCPLSIHIDARGLTWADHYFDGSDSTLFERLNAVDYLNPPYSVLYPELTILLQDDPAIPKGNKIIRNIIINSSEPSLIEGAENITLLKDNVIDDTAEFITSSPPELSPNSNTEIWSSGFVNIPVEKIGPHIDEYRNTM